MAEQSKMCRASYDPSVVNDHSPREKAWVLPHNLFTIPPMFIPRFSLPDNYLVSPVGAKLGSHPQMPRRTKAPLFFTPTYHESKISRP